MSPFINIQLKTIYILHHEVQKHPADHLCHWAWFSPYLMRIWKLHFFSLSWLTRKMNFTKSTIDSYTPNSNRKGLSITMHLPTVNTNTCQIYFVHNHIERNLSEYTFSLLNYLLTCAHIYAHTAHPTFSYHVTKSFKPANRLAECLLMVAFYI